MFNETVKNIRIIFILGPSGVGKSTFGKFLELEHEWLHCEEDPIIGSGLDILGLRDEWNAFYNDINIIPLASKLRQRMFDNSTDRCVLTFSSAVVLTEEHMQEIRSASIELICLFGAKEHCLKAFIEREGQNNRNLPQSHWEKYNSAIFEWMQAPNVRDKLLDVFDVNGNRRSLNTLLSEIEMRQ